MCRSIMFPNRRADGVYICMNFCRQLLGEQFGHPVGQSIHRAMSTIYARCCIGRKLAS